MKSIECKVVNLRQIIAVVLLGSILSSVVAAIAVAAPSNLSKQKENLTTQQPSNCTAQLPRALADAVRQDVAQRENIPISKLQVTALSQETWSDGCLGLAQPDEFCTQALVEGWRVQVTDDRSTWIYRTDSLGRVMRREVPQNTSALPAFVVDVVRQ